MTERPDSPTTDELLKRIVQLEGMSALVKKQQAEMNSLKATIADLGGAFKSHVTNTANNLKNIHDQLWPLVHKVFPGAAKTQQQIAAVMRNGGRSWDDKKSS
jgi:hypothetical protein